MEKITKREINDYLYFGYIPGFGKVDPLESLFNLENQVPTLSSGIEEEDLIAEGKKILNQVFDELVAGKEDEKHLVPLSGGLDSRVIFAALLERVRPENIYAVTFGSPHSMDFEIPKKVVKGTGVNYERIDCTKLDYSIQNLIEAARNGGEWTSTPDMYVNRLALKLDENYCRWSGFIGDFIAGSYSGKGREKGSNYEKFASSQKRSRTINLTENGYSPKDALINIDEKNFLNLNHYELIALYNKIPASTFPVLFPNNADLITPLIHPKWAKFMLSLPETYRRNSYLFKKIILDLFPESMSIGCKANGGLALTNRSKVDIFLNTARLKIRNERSRLLRDIQFPPPGVNYMYYPEAIRQLPSLKKAVQDSCNDLDEKKVIPWISATKIFKEHSERKADHSSALLAILGLKINLEAQGIGKASSSSTENWEKSNPN